MALPERDPFETLFERGVTDGLPVVPPTRERVAAMVAGSGREADELIALVPPNFGRATVEKIAINAVMAGCRPEYLPVVIAGVEAMCDDAFDLHGVSATTNFHSPLFVVNGPARTALDIKGDTETTVVAWAGDGGTFDIGIQALSAAAERNENFIYICYDNEAYMNTGVQRSSATPLGAWTTTTPAAHLKEQPKKDLLAIMAAHRIPYAATATVAYPDDLIAKVERDAAIALLAKEHGPMGSGYPHDEETIAFVEKWLNDNGKLPPFARKSWNTAQRLMDKQFQKKLF